MINDHVSVTTANNNTVQIQDLVELVKILSPFNRSNLSKICSMEFKPDACQKQYKFLLCIFNRSLIYVQNTNSILDKFLF